MSLQNELQEVLGTDEEAGPLDSDEAASPDFCEEEKGQEDTEPSAPAALLTADQVGSGGVPRVPWSFCVRAQQAAVPLLQ